jgi:hypothetical protein
MKFVALFVSFLTGLTVGYLLQPKPLSQTVVATSSVLPGLQPSAPRATAAPALQKPTFQELAEPLTERVQRYTQGMSAAEIQAALVRLKAGTPSERTLMSELLGSWARLDPQGAWRYAESLTDTGQRLAAFTSVVGEWAKTHPLMALPRVLALSSVRERSSVFTALLSGWISADPRAAVAYWNSHPELPDDSLSGSLALEGLAAKEPALAANLALTFRSTSPISSTLIFDELNRTMKVWIGKDPVAALKWAESLQNQDHRDRAIQSVAKALIATDPQKAFSLAEKQSNASLKSRLFNDWIAVDPKAAIQYLSKRPTAEIDSLVGSSNYSLSKLSGKEQQQFLAALPEGKAKNEALQDLVRSQGRTGRYPEAIQLLNEMPNSKERDRSLHSLAADWSKKDPATVERWIQQQGDSSDRDFIMAAHAAQTAKRDPTAALSMAAKIPDPSVRKGAEKNIYQAWAQKDRDSANRWLNANSAYTPSERSIMQKMFDSTARFLSVRDFFTTPTVSSYR